MARNHGLKPSEQAMVEGYLDPCGEFEGNQQGMVWHDGALPKSAAVHHREIFNVKYPEQDEVGNSLNTATYSLTVWQLPLAETPLIIVAHESSALTLDELRSVRDVLDGGAIPDFPDWARVGDEKVWVCKKKFVVFKNASIQQQAKKWRISNQGVTISFNAPDIVNQGLVYAGQWANDYQEVEIQSEFDFDNPILGSMLAPPWTTGDWRAEVHVPAWLTPTNQFAMSVEGDVLKVTLRNASNPAVGQIQRSNPVTFTATAEDEQFRVLAGGEAFTYTGQMFVRSFRERTTTTFMRGFEFSDTLDFEEIRHRVFGTTDNAPTATFAAIAEYVPTVEHYSPASAAKLTLPIPDPDQMLQGNPQFFAMQAKLSQGVYMPLRMTQPVAELQDGDNYRSVIFALDGGGDRRITGGLEDSVDRNFAVGAILISDISKAATLMIKIMRTIEVDPGQTGAWQAFAEKTPDVNPALITIIKTVQDAHPHAYPATYNGFGTLFGIVHNLIGSIPIIGDLGGAVANLLPELLGTLTGGKKPGPGQASNEELLQQLLMQLPTLLHSLSTQ